MHVENQPSSSWHSRARVLMTIPHAIFILALLILSIFIIFTIRGEQARQRQSDRMAQRCAFVYLASMNRTNIGNLATSLRNLNRYVKFDFNYKIIIVHSDVPPVIQGRLQAVSEAPVEFRLFDLQAPLKDYSLRIMNSLNNSNDNNENSIKSIEKEIDIQKQFKTNHKKRLDQHEMRFWFYTACLNDVAHSSPFFDIDYIVRLDPDWNFESHLSRDFLRDFVRVDAQYGYFQKVDEQCSTNSTSLVTLKDLVTSYVDLNGITPRSLHFWSLVIKPFPPQDPICLPSFLPQLEVINLRFFRSHSGIQDLLRVIDSNGGIYLHGWKDSVLRFITVSLYAAQDKVIAYNPKVFMYRYIKQTPKARPTK